MHYFPWLWYRVLKHTLFPLKNLLCLVDAILRNRRSDYCTRNKTESKHTPDGRLTPDKLVSNLRKKLCQSSIGRCSQGPPGPPKVPQVLPVHQPREEKEGNEDEEDRKETMASWNCQEKVESKAWWDRQDRRVKLDKKDTKDTGELLTWRELKENQVNRLQFLSLLFRPQRW